MLGSTDRRDVGEIGTHTLQGQQLGPVAQILGVTRSVDHREPSRLTTEKVTAKPEREVHSSGLPFGPLLVP